MSINLNKIANSMMSVGGLVLGTLALSKMIYKVEPGERAIIFNKFGGKGVSKEVRGEGFHFYIPVVQEIIKYDVKIQPYDYFSFTGTKDMQKVEIKIKIFFRQIKKAGRAISAENPHRFEPRLHEPHFACDRQRSAEIGGCSVRRRAVAEEPRENREGD